MSVSEVKAIIELGRVLERASKAKGEYEAKETIEEVAYLLYLLFKIFDLPEEVHGALCDECYKIGKPAFSCLK